ncbi:hypothetical protein KGY73_08345 [bacterium]|nr:hypothetical protein [bacterium]
MKISKHTMSLNVVDKVGDVKIYGEGLLGGKGEGLVKINECKIPQAHKLRTRILTTNFYDRFLEQGRTFGDEEQNTFAQILERLGKIPISVRSSATNEACISAGGRDTVHAGENTSFMLPNNHPQFSVRFNQFLKAVYYIYNDFINNQPSDSQEKMAIVINPIPGVFEDTRAGPVYYPLVSGVANSFFPYALKNQNPEEGFARVAFGHGYATVLDDFPVVSMATVKNPIPVHLLGKGQRFFYSLDMSRNQDLQGYELETMKKLNVNFAHSPTKQKMGERKGYVTFKNLVHDDLYGFRSGLREIMEVISSQISSHFLIEFVFNLHREGEKEEKGTFHVVQLTELPERKFEPIVIPKDWKEEYLSIRSLQGHGVKRGIKYALVVSPFVYTKDQHDKVRRQIAESNRQMKAEDDNFILIVPGRLGTKNRDWGIQADYRDVDRASAIFEYGVDIAGRADPVPEKDVSEGGGIYGSHFLYMIQGGEDEKEKRLKTRIYGTQGTHFFTNLMSHNVIYGYIDPIRDKIDPWFFKTMDKNEAVGVLEFPQPVSVYADSLNQTCTVGKEKG